MRIVVLDGNTLNPGDLSWDALNALGQCVVHERTHIAWATRAARERLMHVAVENLRAFLDGWPVNVVNI